jgi:lysophospholipase L1-like esterase
MVCVGDSFTEGVGDEDPLFPNGVRGWADRAAEQLAALDPDFRYANLAVRGKLLRQVLVEQVEPALALRPTLVTLFAGGNDLLRPAVDIDALVDSYEDAVARFADTGAQVVVFTVADGLFRRIRGRVAIYNELVRIMAARHNALVADMFALRQLRDARMWAPDRLHLNPLGHNDVAAAFLDTLGVEHKLRPTVLGTAPVLTPRQRRAANLQWSREHLVPWVQRRIRGVSSGDTIHPKRPDLAAWS